MVFVFFHMDIFYLHFKVIPFTGFPPRKLYPIPSTPSCMWVFPYTPTQSYLFALAFPKCAHFLHMLTLMTSQLSMAGHISCTNAVHFRHPNPCLYLHEFPLLFQKQFQRLGSSLSPLIHMELHFREAGKKI